jgi:aldose sugar dehydrogenase
MKMQFKLVALGASILAITLACSGQADGAAASKTPFTVEDVSSFNDPWAMAFLPDGRALITEKAGRLLLWNAKTNATIIVGNVPKPHDAGQGGMGDVVLHPKFASNGLVYLSWAELGADGTSGAVVARARLVETTAGATLQDVTPIWRQSPFVKGNGHFGHRLAFGPDGKLYISSGDRQKFDPAQDMSSNLGKIVRLNEDGSVPSDNPHAAKGGVTAQIWVSGLRNPLGLAFDKAGQLWEIEMGPRDGDELNLITPGKNYGYPKVSNGDHYDGRKIPDHKPGDGFEPPKAFWNPAISPGSLMIYQGNRYPGWTGDAFVGALGGEALVRVDLNGSKAGKIDNWPMKTRIREVDQSPDGTIWLLEDGEDGRLMRLKPR